MRRVPRTDRRAFTLIEVAASVAILGGVLAGALALRARARQAAYAAQETQTCAALCADRVAALRGGVTGVGRGSFRTPRGYRWSIRALRSAEATSSRRYEVSVRPPSGEAENGATVVVWVYRRADAEEESR